MPQPSCFFLRFNHFSQIHVPWAICLFISNVFKNAILMIFLPPLFFHGGNIFLEVLTAPFLKHFPNRIILKWNGSSLFKEKLSVPSVSTSSFAPAPNPAVCFVWLLFLHDGCDPSWQQPPVYLLSSQKHLWLLTLSSSWLPTGFSKLFSLCISSYFSYYFIYLSSRKIFYSFCSFTTGIHQDSILVLSFPVHDHQAPN